MSFYRLRKEGLQWREIDGEAVVVDIPSSLYLSANASGTLLWAALARGATNHQLAKMLVAKYGISADRAKEDVERFLGGLLARGLLEVACDA